MGYNLAIVCVASTATNNTAGQIYSLPYAVELYFNEKLINKCGGKRSDREERKVCTYVIRNSSKSDSGEYRCYAKNSYICTVGSIQLDFKGIWQLHLNLFIILKIIIIIIIIIMIIS